MSLEKIEYPIEYFNKPENEWDISIHDEERWGTNMDKFQKSIFEGDYVTFSQLLNDPETKLQSTTDRGFTPLAIASFEGTIEIVSALIQAGCDVNYPGANNDRSQAKYLPIFIAVGQCNEEITKLLLDNGADTSDVQDGNGRSLISLAVYNNDQEICDLLMKANAPFDVTSVEYYTAANSAILKGNIEFLKIALPKTDLAAVGSFLLSSTVDEAEGEGEDNMYLVVLEALKKANQFDIKCFTSTLLAITSLKEEYMLTSLLSAAETANIDINTPLSFESSWIVAFCGYDTDKANKVQEVLGQSLETFVSMTYNQIMIVSGWEDVLKKDLITEDNKEMFLSLAVAAGNDHISL